MTEPTTPATIYIVGRNLTGYLSESDPVAFDTFDNARDALVSDMERAKDETLQSCDEGDEEARDIEESYNRAIGEVKGWTVESLGSGDTAYANDGRLLDMAYWIHAGAHNGGADAYNSENVEGFDA